MFDGDGPVEQDEARAFIADLPSDPEAVTDEELAGLGRLALSENHGTVSIVGEFVKELARTDASELHPILPELVEVIVHTDSIRRGDYVEALVEFDRDVLDPHDPIDDCYATLVDEASDDLSRVKAADAIGAYYPAYPESVSDVAPDLLRYFTETSFENKQVGEHVGRSLGQIAVHDPDIRDRITARLAATLDDDAYDSEAKLEGVLDGLGHIVHEEPAAVAETVDSLVELAADEGLDERFSKVRRADVLRTLGKYGEADIDLLRPEVDRLAELLTDENRFVREGAAKLFGEVGETDPAFVEPAIDRLVSACTDDDADSRRAAIDALTPFEERQAVGAEQAVPMFVDEVADLREDAWANRDDRAAYGLSMCAEVCPDVVESSMSDIVPALDSPSGSIRSGIATTLGRLGKRRPEVVRHTVDPGVAGESTPKSAVPLVDALDDDREMVRSSAATALGDLTAGDPSLFEYTRQPLVDALDDDDWAVERCAVLSVGRIGAERPAAVSDTVPALISRLGNKDASVRAAAAEALGEVGAADRDTVAAAEQPLVDCLDDHAARVRAAACEALMNLGTERAGWKLRQLTDDPEKEVRTAATDAVETLGIPDDVQPPGSEGIERGVSDEERAPTRSERSTADGDGTSGGEPEPTAQSGAASRVPAADSVSTPPKLDVSYDDIERQERLGRGGTAEVYRATVETDDGVVEVAVKEPHFDGTVGPQVVERFRTEVDVWERISDRPGVVDIVDWGEHPLPWVTMEYMDGGSLAARVGEVGLEEALWVCERVAHTVRHDRTGVHHLDLKPSNVLFRETADGEWDVPKVADWGLARMVAETNASSDGLTVTYAAPEQFNPEEYGTPDSRTDIYQLGVLTYELLTGDPPFTGPNHRVMHSVLHEQPAPASSRRTDLPPAIDDVLDRALQKRKADRYETVERFHAALRKIRQRE